MSASVLGSQVLRVSEAMLLLASKLLPPLGRKALPLQFAGSQHNKSVRFLIAQEGMAVPVLGLVSRACTFFDLNMGIIGWECKKFPERFYTPSVML